MDSPRTSSALSERLAHGVLQYRTLAAGLMVVLLFVVDILNEESTLLVPNDLVKTVAKKSFDADADGDSVVLPGVVSRKKQIIPNLAL